MEPFTLLFLKGRGAIGRLIRFFTKGAYSHVALVIDNYHLIEADWNYPVSVKHITYRTNQYDIKKLNIELSDEQKMKIIEFFHNETQRGYDYLYLLFRLLYILFRVKVRNDKYRYTCDEYIYEAFLAAGIKLVDDGVLLTPQSLSESKLLE